jgi:hypothetical protein
MKNIYKVYACFGENAYTKRKINALITETKSYNKAVKKACELTQSPAVWNAFVFFNDSTSLVEKEIFNCCRNEFSFCPDSIDADCVYTTPQGKIIKPPKQYYELHNKAKPV